MTNTHFLIIGSDLSTQNLGTGQMEVTEHSVFCLAVSASASSTATIN